MAWETILDIKDELRQNSYINDHHLIRSSSLSLNRETTLRSKSCQIEILFSEDKKYSSDADMTVISHAPFKVKIEYFHPFPDLNRRIFELYLPYVFLPYYARKLNKTFVVTHFAQSLDGRIASISGDSKWIGNQQNLIHAHRMRALLDGIIVGAKTLEADNPRLTVRHVEGENPCKIIIGGDKLELDDYRVSKDEIIIFCQNHKNSDENFIIHQLEKDKNYFKTSDMLRILYQKGIHSVYIEGGSITTSTFLSQHSVDQVQIHFAPIILGSGITGFNFKGVEALKEGIHFKSFRFHPVGDEMMFIGELN
jgi:riboflavin-specific deaminase-like protein